MSANSLVSPSFLVELADQAEKADSNLAWPDSSWRILQEAGVLAWILPTSFGGKELGSLDLLHGYGELAAACLTTTFLLSQREAACRRIRDGDNKQLQQELLPALCRGESFATVGISQLTTSRQHTKPAMTGRLMADALILEGVMPWVTGASHADYLVTAAVLPDSKQVLAVVPKNRPGLEVGPPLDLLALRGSLTSEVRCHEVVLDRRWILAGPVENVLASRHGGVGGLETSCLALGLADATITFLIKESQVRPELIANADSLHRSLGQLRQEMFHLAQQSGTNQTIGNLRAKANRLVLRSTQSAMMAGKGTAFVHPHPVQRWARQALFFLVWSCPRVAADATLAYLSHDNCEEAAPH